MNARFTFSAEKRPVMLSVPFTVTAHVRDGIPLQVPADVPLHDEKNTPEPFVVVAVRVTFVLSAKSPKQLVDGGAQLMPAGFDVIVPDVPLRVTVRRHMPVADPVKTTEDPVTATVTVAERAPAVLGTKCSVIVHIPPAGMAAVHVFDEISISLLDGVTVGTELARSPVFVIVYVIAVELS